MTNALNRIVSAIENTTGKPAKWTGDNAKLVCTHDGATHYNLSVKDGSDRVLLHCHSHGCDPKDILESVGLTISDIYHQQLTPKEQRQHKVVINDRQLRNEFEHEILILLCWISDSNELLFPIGEHDIERVKLAMKRINTAAEHYLAEGIV